MENKNKSIQEIDQILSQIRLIGDPVLHSPSKTIDPCDSNYLGQKQHLQEALEAFRQKYGFGRAISAPQLGYQIRIIAINLGQGAFTMNNPEIIYRSDEKITLWDDCMSFPDMLVKLKRNKHISVQWFDDQSQKQIWENLDVATSELLQHEIDHLDGITSFDRIEGSNSVIHRKVYELDKDKYHKQVDYYILSLQEKQQQILENQK